MKNKVKSLSVIFLIVMLTVNVISLIGESASLEKNYVNTESYSVKKSISMDEKVGFSTPVLRLLTKNPGIIHPALEIAIRSIIVNDRSKLYNDRESDPDSTDQQQTQYDNGAPISGRIWGAQSFKPTKNLLSKIELYVKRSVDTRTKLVVSIREDLNGEDLTRMEVSPEIIQTEMNWEEFDFEDIRTEPEETYYIVVHTTDISSVRDQYQWGAAQNTEYTRGMAHGSIDGGHNWISRRTADFCFKTYGNSGNNRPPVANDDYAETYEGETVTIDVLENDYDPDNDTIKLARIGQPKNGIAKINKTLNPPLVDYTPNNNFTGKDTFKYLIVDEHSSEAERIRPESIGRVNITVKSSKVIANNDTITIDEDTKNNKINVLLNDQGKNLIITNITDPQHGEAAIDEENISYTPDPNYFGNDSFVYTIRSGSEEEKNNSDTATVKIIIENKPDPPNQPESPEGAPTGIEKIEYEISFSTIDPDYDDVYYKIDWGDNTISEWKGPYESGVVCQASHIYYSTGTYEIKVKAKDEYGLETNWSDPLIVEILNDNNPPSIPEIIYGLKDVKADVSYKYKSSSNDIEQDQIKYGWDFNGDNTVDKWTDFYDSGDTASITYSWDTVGTYYIKVKAEDRNGKQSEFSEELKVTVSHNNPPEQPHVSAKVKSGKPGISHTLYISSIDPDGDDIYYMFDWGDNTNSDWLGPYESGVEYKITHIFENPGTYKVKVKAIDDPNNDGDISDGIESSWSERFTLKIYEPELNVKIKEGINILGKVTASIKNTGETDVNNIGFKLFIEYGIFGKTKEDSKEDLTIKVNEEKTIIIDKIQRGIGPFGPITVVATVSLDDAIHEQVVAKGFTIGRLIFLGLIE